MFWLVLGYDAALVFGGGFLAGYLAYDMLHYHVHHHTPRTAVGHKLRELHMRHHFQDDETRLRHQRAVLGLRLRHLDRPATGNRALAGQHGTGTGGGPHDSGLRRDLTAGSGAPIVGGRRVSPVDAASLTS